MASGRAHLRRSVSGVSIVKKTVTGVVAHGIPVRELVFLPLTEFPMPGDSHCLYIDISGNALYFWDDGQYWSLSSSSNVYSGTTEYWNQHQTEISKRDAIYIYTDFDTKDGKNIPSIKIGDGLGFVNTLPFISACGITQEDINFWNNKVSVKLSSSDTETVVFYTGKE